MNPAMLSSSSHVWFSEDVGSTSDEGSLASAEELQKMALLRRQIGDLDQRIAQARLWRPTLPVNATTTPNIPNAGLTITRASIQAQLAKIRSASVFLIQVRARKWLRGRARKRALIAQEMKAAADALAATVVPQAVLKARKATTLQCAWRRYLARRLLLRLRAQRAATVQDAEAVHLSDMQARRAAMEAKCAAAEVQRAAGAAGEGAQLSASASAPRARSTLGKSSASPKPYFPGSWLLFGGGASATPGSPTQQQEPKQRTVLSLVSPARAAGAGGLQASPGGLLGDSSQGGSGRQTRLATVESVGEIDEEAEASPASGEAGASLGTHTAALGPGGDARRVVAGPPPPPLVPVCLLPGATDYAREAVRVLDPAVWLKSEATGAEAAEALEGHPVAADAPRGPPAPVAASAPAAALRAEPPRPPPSPPAASAAYSPAPAPAPIPPASARAPELAVAPAEGAPEGGLSSAQLGQLDAFLASVERTGGGLGAIRPLSGSAPAAAALAGGSPLRWLSHDFGVFSHAAEGGSPPYQESPPLSTALASPQAPPQQHTYASLHQPPLQQRVLPLASEDSAALTEPVARYLAAASAKAAATSPNTAWLQRMTALDPLGARGTSGSAATAALLLAEDEDEAVLAGAAAAIVAAAKSRSVAALHDASAPHAASEH